jgi:uncharacterized protein with PQ loop repeat
MSEWFGWLSALCFSFSALPQVIKVYQTKLTRDLSWGTLILWLGGELFGLVYIFGLTEFPWPIFVNYILNGVMVGWLVQQKFNNERRY